MAERDAHREVVRDQAGRQRSSRRCSNVGYLTYDDQFFYAAFEFDDPDPSRDSRAVRRSRQHQRQLQRLRRHPPRRAQHRPNRVLFLVDAARTSQYDSITDDSTDEDSSPDFFWDSATKITRARLDAGDSHPVLVAPLQERGSADLADDALSELSARLPLSVLFGAPPARQQLLRLPRQRPDGARAAARRRPHRRRAVCAPRATWPSAPAPPGSPLDDAVAAAARRRGREIHCRTPTTPIDLTVKPDFSQIESDTAQIATNQRFALFFPEKRPFFLEGIDLFATPIQAVYTRTITAPVGADASPARRRASATRCWWRTTMAEAARFFPGRTDRLRAQSTSDPPCSSRGRSATSACRSSACSRRTGSTTTSGRNRAGIGYNRVVGPDFPWRPSGQRRRDRAVAVQPHDDAGPARSRERVDRTDADRTRVASPVEPQHDAPGLVARYSATSATGFAPTPASCRRWAIARRTATPGWTVQADQFSVADPYLRAREPPDRHPGSVISRDIQPGVGMDSKLSGFMQFQYVDDTIRTPAGVLIGRRQFGTPCSSARRASSRRSSPTATLGEDIDFENSRPAHGPTINSERDTAARPITSSSRCWRTSNG